MLVRLLKNPRLPAALAFIGIGLILALCISRETPVGAIKGRAVAMDTGNPIPASVWLTSVGEANELQIYAKCKDDGSFELPRVPAGNYTLEIAGRVYSMSPVPVTIEEGRTETIQAELSPSDPTLDLFIHQPVFTPDELPQITCHGFVKPDVLDLKIYRVDLDDFLLKSSNYLPDLIGVSSYEYSKDPRDADLAENESLQLVDSLIVPIKNRDLEGLFTQRIKLPSLAPGLYVTRVRAGDVGQLGWIMVTSIGLITKTANAETLAFVVNLKTGTPVSDAAVLARTGEGVVSGRTDEEGIVALKLPDRRSGDEQTIVARTGDSVAFTSAWLYGRESLGKVFYSYTDRPVYRPGHKVHFRGVVRQSTPEGYAVPSSAPVTVEVRDPRDTLIHRSTTQTNEFGCYSGDLELNPEAVTGFYTMTASIGGERPNKSTYFQVAAYKKPQFSVKIAFPKKRYVRGGRVRASLNATYYFGSPVANAEVTYLIRRSDYSPWYDEDEFYMDGYYYEDYGGYGEIIEEGRARTNSNGDAVIEFTADWPQPEEPDMWDPDQEFSVEAVVTEKGGTTAEATASVLATRGEFAIDVSPDRYVVTSGGSTKVSIQAQDYDKRPVKNCKVTVTATRREWTRRDSRLVKLYEKQLTTDSKGKASLDVSLKSPGSVTITATAKDRRGNTITGSAWVWSYSGAYAYEEGARYPDIQVVLDKKVYDPGDTARVLINAKDAGVTALVTVEGDRIHERRIVELTTNSTLVELPVKGSYAPNFYVGVCFVKDKAFAEQQVRARISLKAKALEVAISADKKEYEPGEDAEYKVKVTGPDGKPVAAELSLGVVDEAIYAIAEDDTEPILDYFYARKPNEVNTTFSFPRIYLSDPDKAGPASLEAKPENVRIRKRFLDTAFWIPGIVTNSNGEAVVKFQMPDNLTTWRTTVRGITKNTECGEAKHTVVTRQDFMVRLEMPRFMVQSDTSTLTAVVHNNTGESKQVDVEIKCPGMTIRGSAKRSIRVNDGNVGRVDWTVTAPKPGNIPITVRAVAPGSGDAMEAYLPVQPHGVARTVLEVGSLAGDQQKAFNMDVRADAIPEATRLKIRLAPSLASAMLGSLEYLAQYPYGCTEQTTSSFLPNVVISRTLKDLGIHKPSLEAQLPDMVEKGLFRLYRFQMEDGGWGWSEYGKSDPWMTAYVCYGLLRAKEAGFEVNKGILDSGVRRLKEHASRQDLSRDVRTYVYYVLALAGQDVARQMRAIAEDRSLDARSLAQLALGFASLGDVEQAQVALRRLHGRATRETGLIYWSERHDGASVETTALALEAVVKLTPDDDRVTDIVRWLMQRRSSNYWYSTRDTAMVLYAMSEFLRTSSEASPDFEAEVIVNGKSVARKHFAREQLFDPEIEVRLPYGSLPKGRNSIVIRKTGQGNLYYAAELTQHVSRDLKAATVTGSGLTISREYYRPSSDYYSLGSPDPGSTVKGCRVGDVVLVRLTVTSNAHVPHLLLEDCIPAGSEILDRGSVSNWEWRHWWVGQDVRDEKISFYVEDLHPGKHQVEYRIRAGSRGAYHALPAQIFAMYEPSLRAVTSETEFAIR